MAFSRLTEGVRLADAGRPSLRHKTREVTRARTLPGARRGFPYRSHREAAGNIDRTARSDRKERVCEGFVRSVCR